MAQHLLQKFKAYLAHKSPGDRLPGEIELAKMFGVSRGTIRETITYFGHLGILDRGTKRGTFVTGPGIDEIGEVLAFQIHMAGCGFEELKETRLCLELSMLPLLIRLLTTEGAQKLTTLIDHMEARAKKPRAADALDLQFHLALADITGNRVLKIFAKVLVLLFEDKYRQKFLNPKAVLKSVADHRGILNAILSGDQPKLEKLIREHLKPL